MTETRDLRGMWGVEGYAGLLSQREGRLARCEGYAKQRETGASTTGL